MIRLVSGNRNESGDMTFTREVKEKSQAHLERCYQCIACSSGCPVAFAMDYAPHQVLRMTQLGIKERVLDSTTIWLCASCETCATRCPNEINIVQVMDILRSIALREGRTGQTKLPLFHTTFLDGVRSNGKIHELMLILRYTVTSGNLFKFKKLFWDTILGIKMFTKGRLAILPDKIERIEEVRRIFQLARQEDRINYGKTKV